VDAGLSEQCADKSSNEESSNAASRSQACNLPNLSDILKTGTPRKRAGIGTCLQHYTQLPISFDRCPGHGHVGAQVSEVCASMPKLVVAELAVSTEHLSVGLLSACGDNNASMQRSMHVFVELALSTGQVALHLTPSDGTSCTLSPC
jgi:hypothetical protein